jgi:hypothetical protein
VSAMPTLCRGFCTTTTVEEGRQQHSFEESISSQTSLDGLSALCIKEVNRTAIPPIRPLAAFHCLCHQWKSFIWSFTCGRKALSLLLTLILFAILTQSQNFSSDDASSAILLASMMLLDPSCACDKESLSKAVRDRKLLLSCAQQRLPFTHIRRELIPRGCNRGTETLVPQIGCLSARCLDLMPNFGPNNIADSLFGYAMASSRGFPMSPDLTKAIIVRLWVPEDQGGVKLAPYHSSQMILGIGHLDVESRGPDLVATVCSTLRAGFRILSHFAVPSSHRFPFSDLQEPPHRNREWQRKPKS